MTQSEEVVYCLIIDRTLHEFVPFLQVPDTVNGRWSLPKGVAPLSFEARANSSVIRLRSVEDLVAATKNWFDLFSNDKVLHITYPGNSRLFNQCEDKPGDFIIVDGDGEQRVYGRKVIEGGVEKFHITFTLKNELPGS